LGRRHRHATSNPEPATTSEHDAARPQAHKRHHAHSAEPTNDTEPPASAQASPESGGQVAPDATPQPTRESRHKHQRSPRNVEPSQSAKQQPDMTPTGVAGPAGGTTEPAQTGTGAGKEPVAAHGGEPNHAPNAPAHANREGPADAVEPGSYTAPASPVSLHASETGAVHGSEPPSASAGSGDQPAFSAPSP
jgi:hypothetical protein